MTEISSNLPQMMADIERQYLRIDNVNKNLNSFVKSHMAVQKEEMTKMKNMISFLADEIKRVDKVGKHKTFKSETVIPSIDHIQIERKDINVQLPQSI